MARIGNSRKDSGADSYDVWDAGSRNPITHFNIHWNGRTDLPLIAARCMDVSRRDRRWYRHVNYPLLALELILNGAVEYRNDHRIQVATAGMLYVVSRHSNVRIVNADALIRRKLTLLLSGECLDSIANTLGFGKDQLLTLSDPRKTEEQIRTIAALIADETAAAELSVRIYELLLTLASDLPRRSEELRPALAELNRNPSGTPTVPNLAALCGLSVSTFRRRFRQQFGCSPLEYRSGRRLTLGAELLRSGNTPIKEIAPRCGYASALRFALAFKACYGLPPTLYRKKHRQNAVMI